MPADVHAAARAIEQFLQALGLSPEREPELRGTPERVAQAWAEQLLAGYRVDVEALLGAGSLAPTGGHAREVITLRGIAVATVCPHHLLPALGEATLSYVPGERWFGLGTLTAVVHAYARRLSLQEVIGRQVAEALVELGGARAARCTLRLRHACQAARGEREHGVEVVSVAQAGQWPADVEPQE